MADCYNCCFRGTIPGDTHSTCKNKKRMEVTIDEHGYKHGWAYFPGNFDPIWVTCDGFKKKEMSIDD